MSQAEVTAFLTHLAAERDVAASTQNQALSALLFFPLSCERRDGEIVPWLATPVRGLRAAERWLEYK